MKTVVVGRNRRHQAIRYTNVHTYVHTLIALPLGATDEGGQALSQSCMNDLLRLPIPRLHCLTLQCKWSLRSCAMQWFLEKIRNYFENLKEPLLRKQMQHLG